MSHSPVTTKLSGNGSTPLVGGVDTEVSIAKAERRHFTAEYKLRIVREAEQCGPGGIGALLRREGLYSSHLTTWRRQLADGQLAGLAPKKRGPKVDPQAAELARLKRENERLQVKLQQAEAIIAAQKKLAELFGMTLNEQGEPE
jgi:transposase-like protein